MFSAIPFSDSLSPTPATVTSTATSISTTTFASPQNETKFESPRLTRENGKTDSNVTIAVCVSLGVVIFIILLAVLIFYLRKRRKQKSYAQRCRPATNDDDYNFDRTSILGSIRRKITSIRSSRRSYGNSAFADPTIHHNILQSLEDLTKFTQTQAYVYKEFKDIPQIIARITEMPPGCEEKNRYANVIPLPETRVHLQRRGSEDETSEYINANYVRGPKDTANYYIACQAPLETTIADFWRMIWEQNSRVIIQATDLFENDIEKCAEYLPSSITLNNNIIFGDIQVTLKNREIKDQYAISLILLKNIPNDISREITHYWYRWPLNGVPSEETPIISLLLEARLSLKNYASEDSVSDSKELPASDNEIFTKMASKPRKQLQGPLTVHCSPGTGRTGTIIACDTAMYTFERTKSLDLPQIVYNIRRDRASAVQTKEQYEFIYKVVNAYALKITSSPNEHEKL